VHVTIVQVQVKPGSVDAFIEARRVNHEGSVQEPGNHRFDILQDAADPTRFVLYEAYACAADAVAHKETAHYLQWRERVAGMMAAPREGRGFVGLFPAAG
jgi:autoinducer 2-degrading protein